MQCTKPEQDLGIDLQEEDNLLSVQGIDTFTIRSYTILEDSVRSDKLNPAMVGAYVDPVFGFVKAGHVTELRLSSGNPVFVPPGSDRSDLVVDSLVLGLSFQSNLTGRAQDAHYGNLGPQFFRVYELQDSLSVDSQYFHTRDVNFLEPDLVLPGRNMVTPNPTDTSTINGQDVLPEIRLPLDTEIGERILSVNNGNGITATQFVTAIKGLFITVDETMMNPFGAGIIYFDTFSQLSRVSMYYRNTSTEEDFRYDFFIRNNSGKFGVFDHGYEVAEDALRRQVLMDDLEAGNRDLYVQAIGGTKLRIELPHIETLRGLTGTAINKAVLTLPIRGSALGSYAPPGNLFVFGLNENGDAFLLDDQIDGGGFVGGALDLENGRYRFTITRYLQQVINGTRPFNGLEIVSSGAAFSANRVVINGPDYPDPATPENNTKLEIIFTNY
ncbi:MAG: DUF4270 family protein [Cryomorphaceae bacterium]